MSNKADAPLLGNPQPRLALSVTVARAVLPNMRALNSNKAVAESLSVSGGLVAVRQCGAAESTGTNSMPPSTTFPVAARTAGRRRLILVNK